jgi:hypothetical protein
MIFISYRHKDALAVRSLQVSLEASLGRALVVRDISSFPPGADLRSVILDQLSQAVVVLAVIGPSWATPDPVTEQLPLSDPRDWVRFELSAALAWGKDIIPVLVEQAVMPDRSTLPSDIAALSERIALRVRDSDWEADLAKLLERISPGSSRPIATPPRVERSGPVAGGNVTIQGHFAAGRDLTIDGE